MKLRMVDNPQVVAQYQIQYADERGNWLTYKTYFSERDMREAFDHIKRHGPDPRIIEVFEWAAQ